MESEIDCGMAMTWASGPEGTCMEFTSTCIPDGWSICNPLDSCETGDDDGSDDAGDGTSDDGPEPLVCGELDPETCGEE